jgi:hypothetical protein
MAIQKRSIPMLEEMYVQDGIQHVRVHTRADLETVVEEHGGSKSDFNGLPRGIDTDPDVIGQVTCTDDITICFLAPDAETAHIMYEQLF